MVWLTPMAGLSRVTVAPGKAPPLPSLTVPAMEPALCAEAEPAIAITAAVAASAARMIFATVSLPVMTSSALLGRRGLAACYVTSAIRAASAIM